VNNVNYSVVVQTPLARMASVADLMATPMGFGANAAGRPLMAATTPGDSGPGGSPYLGSVAVLRPDQDKALISHVSVQRVIDLQASVQGRDLGGVAQDIDKAIAGLKNIPKATTIRVRGQPESMFTSFRSLGFGLLLAIALVYLLLVVLFQSWVDPFIILVAVPGALTGILWTLAATGTTLNVESFMGAIMAVGIAVSNSILLVNYANDIRAGGADVSALTAALQAGKIRLRPVLMTALAMILGMLPMALSLGEAGEQNAPLGRAVIGGLVVATFVTLFLVPVVYSILRRPPPRAHLLDRAFAAESTGASEASHG
jgi:multidrug efflux pump subunit AcrB